MDDVEVGQRVAQLQRNVADVKGGEAKLGYKCIRGEAHVEGCVSEMEPIRVVVQERRGAADGGVSGVYAVLGQCSDDRTV